MVNYFSGCSAHQSVDAWQDHRGVLSASKLEQAAVMWGSRDDPAILRVYVDLRGQT